MTYLKGKQKYTDELEPELRRIEKQLIELTESSSENDYKFENKIKPKNNFESECVNEIV